MAQKLIIANWKMHPQSLAEALRLFKALVQKMPARPRGKVFLAPPFPYLAALAAFRPRSASIGLAAQDVFWEKAGAYTGEVSPTMLKRLGATHVLVGHSERREHLGETNAMVNKKLRAALKAGLAPVLCIGERERVAGEEFPAVLREELSEGLAGVSAAALRNVVIAYEPIWAVGKGKTADTPEDFFAMVIFIRRVLLDIGGKAAATGVPVLYGGSVQPDNAAAFLRVAGAGGVLVGRASLEPNAFGRIVAAAP